MCIAPRNLRRKRRQAPYRQMFRRQVERVHYINTARHARPLVVRYALGKAPRRKIWAIRRCRVPMQGKRFLRTVRRAGSPHSQPRRTAAGTPYRQKQGRHRPRQPQGQRRRAERRKLRVWYTIPGKAAREGIRTATVQRSRPAQKIGERLIPAGIRQTTRVRIPIRRISGAMPLPARRCRVQIRRIAQIKQKMPRTTKAFLSGRAKPPADRPGRTGRQVRERRTLTRKARAVRGRQSMAAGLCGRTAQQRTGKAAPMLCGTMGRAWKLLKRRNAC